MVAIRVPHKQLPVLKKCIKRRSDGRQVKNMKPPELIIVGIKEMWPEVSR